MYAQKVSEVERFCTQTSLYEALHEPCVIYVQLCISST